MQFATNREAIAVLICWERASLNSSSVIILLIRGIEFEDIFYHLHSLHLYDHLLSHTALVAQSIVDDRPSPPTKRTSFCPLPTFPLLQLHHVNA